MIHSIVRLLAAAILAAGIVGNPIHADSQPPSKYLIDKVPYTHQMTNYCGPASLSSLLSFWSISVSQKTIGSAVYDAGTKGTNGADMLLYVHDLGLSAYSFNSTIDELKKYISEGYPVMVLQDRDRAYTEGHFRIAVGFDDSAGRIILRDSTQSGLVKLPYSEFDYVWQKRGRWAMLVMPREKDKFAEALGDENVVYHMDLGQAYLHRKDYKSAEEACKQALKIQPSNPYARDFLSQARAHLGASQVSPPVLDLK